VGLILIGICVWAAIRLHDTPLFAIALVNAIANLWGIGVMFNYKNEPYTPLIPAIVGMISSVAGVVLLIISFRG